MKFEKLQINRGREIEYHLSMPLEGQAPDAQKLLLAIPPGSQNAGEAQLYSSWLSTLQEAGWTSIIPLAPKEKLFYRGSEKLIPHLLDHIENILGLNTARFSILGVSNGGVSAFRIASLNPERVNALLVIPGWPKPADEKRLEMLLNVPIHFFVGAEDRRWLAKSKIFCERIVEMGGRAKLDIVENEGHMLFRAFSGQVILDILESMPELIRK